MIPATLIRFLASSQLEEIGMEMAKALGWFLLILFIAALIAAIIKAILKKAAEQIIAALLVIIFFPFVLLFRAIKRKRESKNAAKEDAVEASEKDVPIEKKKTNEKRSKTMANRKTAKKRNKNKEKK